MASPRVAQLGCTKPAAWRPGRIHQLLLAAQIHLRVEDSVIAARAAVALSQHLFGEADQLLTKHVNDTRLTFARNHPRIRMLRCIARCGLGSYRRALRDADACIRAYPTCRKGYRCRARVQLLFGRRADAAATLATMRARCPAKH
jgi:hypothetical protein